MSNRLGYRIILLLILTALFEFGAYAQAPGLPPPPTVPRAAPLEFTKTLDNTGLPKSLSADERSMIQRTVEKDRFKIYQQLLVSHRDRARRLTNENQFRPALEDLIIYSGLATSAVGYLISLPPKKRDSMLKRLELDLRADVPFLESMRRDFDFYYAENVESLLTVVGQARTDALNALFGSNILRRPGDKAQPTPDDPIKPN